MKLKVFISQPMKNKTNEEIKLEREEIIEFVKSMFFDREIEIIDSFFENAPHDAKPLWFLGKSFELLSTADLAVFARGYEEYRGCRLEALAACSYGINMIEMEDLGAE